MAKPFLFPVAEHLARACAYQYGYDAGWRAQIGSDLIDERRIDDGGDQPTSFACVLSYPDRTIVVYRGTVATVPDWVQNFRIDRTAFEVDGTDVGTSAGSQSLSGEVHRGFLSELRRVQPQVVAALRQLHGEGKSLYLTGHSQGGAVANLGCAALVKAGFAVDAAYTFAAPRAGDRDFAKAVDKATTVHRIELGNDIVPHVPPMIPHYVRKLLSGVGGKLLLAHASPLVKRIAQLADAGYVAVGRLAYGEIGRFVLPGMTATQESELYFDRLRAMIGSHQELVQHHGIQNYINAVDKY